MNDKNLLLSQKYNFMLEGLSKSKNKLLKKSSFQSFTGFSNSRNFKQSNSKSGLMSNSLLYNSTQSKIVKKTEIKRPANPNKANF